MTTYSPKKRKASEMDSSAALNGHTKTKAKKGKKRSSKAASKLSAPGDDSLYQVTCIPKYTEKDPKYKGKSVEKAHLGPDFDWHCHVKRVNAEAEWKDMKSYKNVKLNETTFTQGDVVLVLNSLDAPAPPADGSEEELLEYDKKWCFVAKIVQARATSDKEVYLLVAYLYWPPEMLEQQQKQQRFYDKYYSKGELIMSTHFDVIDATTISSKTDVPFWDECNDAVLQHVPDRFWRQTFEHHTYLAHGTSSKALSDLRKFCKCRRPYNPDKNMWHCPNKGCGHWNHEECLAEDIGDKVWESYKANKMDEYVQNNAQTPPKALSDRVLGPVRAVGKLLEEKVEHLIEDAVEAVGEETLPTLHATTTNGVKKTEIPETPVAKKRGRPPKTPHEESKDSGSWQVKLSVTIAAEDNKPPIGVVKENSAFTPRSWEVKVDCLRCGKTMD